MAWSKPWGGTISPEDSILSPRVSFVTVQMVDSIRRNSSKFTRNFILKAKLITSASQLSILFSLFGNSFVLLCRYAFDTFDANNDGTIDFDEFLLSISATSQGNLDDRLAVAFDM